MRAPNLSLVVVLAAASFLTTGCASERATAQPRTTHVVVVKKAPPALRKEVRPHRPSRRHVWVAGHWGWHRGRHVWVKGHWAKPPHRRAVWVPAHWRRHADGWVFVAGHWRR